MTNKQRGIYTIEVHGVKRSLSFTMNFWAAFTEVLGIELGDIDKVFGKSLSIPTLRALIYAGVLAYDQENKNPIDYNEFDAGVWLEDVTTDDIEGIVNCLTQSKILGNELNGGIRRGVQKTSKKTSVAKKKGV